MGHVCPRCPQSQVPVTLLGLDLLWRWVLPGCTTLLLPQDGEGHVPPSPSSQPTPRHLLRGCGVSRTHHLLPSLPTSRGSVCLPCTKILPVRNRNGCYLCSSPCHPVRSAPPPPVMGL